MSNCNCDCCFFMTQTLSNVDKYTMLNSQLPVFYSFEVVNSIYGNATMEYIHIALGSCYEFVSWSDINGNVLSTDNPWRIPPHVL